MKTETLLGNKAVYVLDYEECRNVIDDLARFEEEATAFMNYHVIP